MTRRGALGSGLSLGAFVALGGSQAAAAEAAARFIRYVVTDRRHAPSLEFGAVLVGRGAIRLEVTDGLTRLWSQMLVPLWEGESQSVAGLTRPETWAGLAEQARSAGRRSVLVGHHVCFEGGRRPAHSLRLPDVYPGITPALERSGDAWPQAMADLAAACSASSKWAADGRHRCPTHVTAPVSLVLTSWMIA